MNSQPRPRTILFLDHTAALSGGEIALLHLVQRLDRSRYRPVVLLSSSGPLEDKLAASGVETHVLPLSDSIVHTKRHDLSRQVLLRVRDLARLLRYCQSVAQFARRHRASLIHTNSLKADLIGGVAGRLARIPVIWHVRDRIDGDYLPPKVARAFRLLCRVLPSYVIANSAATWETLHLPANDVGTAKKSCVVHDGVVLPEQMSADASSFVRTVGLVGRISRWKGQHVFVEAAYTVHQQFPDVRFQIIGAAMFGDQDYEAELKSLIRERDLENIVELVGFQSDVPRFIRQLEILVHASTTGEPFGQVVVEGMLEGKPVIATNGGGIPEIVADGKTGLLVPMGDARAMADAIVRLLKDPATAQRMGQAGQQRAVESFDIRLTVGKVEAVYDWLLHGRRRQTHSVQAGPPASHSQCEPDGASS